MSAMRLDDGVWVICECVFVLAWKMQFEKYSSTAEVVTPWSYLLLPQKVVMQKRNSRTDCHTQAQPLTIVQICRAGKKRWLWVTHVTLDFCAF